MLEDLTGKLLIAMPGIGDSRFARSLVLICAHEPDYAMGIALNKPIEDLTLPQLLTQLGIEQDIRVPDNAVLSGGPVGTDRGFVVHTGDFHSDGATMDVSHDCCLTATRDILQAIASGEAPRESIMALGYSGWGAGQLETEIAENTWLVGEAIPDLVYGGEHDSKWSRALDLLGIDAARLHSGGGNA
ncbi:YqgE/AlgH family protein [Henriciella aquimarina]|uniref:YqgE/AlgH family protein n=1 Tax=Henriciella aquimarina TaxID=545261 RepID=UPI0009FC6B1B|nr:YqgE/AlgH family protein [Henriciella aquimarina]